MNFKKYFFSSLLLFCLMLSGCSFLPASGPTRITIQNRADPATSNIQVVDVDDKITRELLAAHKTKLFSEVFKNKKKLSYGVGPGDILEFSIWEVPPATLFTAGNFDTQGGQIGSSRVANFPEQMVSNNGTINVPFVGAIPVSGLDLQQIQTKIAKSLEGKASQPQVLVKLIRNTTSKVTIVGEVNQSTLMPLTPRGERLLDAMAVAGGVKQSVSKMTVQVTRGNSVHAEPLDTVIRDPRQNIVLQPGDVVTALYQPLSFTVLGATGKSEEINFEAQGISLAQALARAGGIQDGRADPQGVFVFRFEPANALNTWPKKPVMTTPEGMVPIVYEINLKDPRTFFVAQSFPIYNKDILYVSNAPLVELQKFLNVLLSVVSPALYLSNTTVVGGSR